MADGNPLLEPWAGIHGAPPFDRVRPEHFPAAIDAGIEAHRVEIEAITANPEAPDFENTFAALERSGETLSRVRRLFWTLSSAQAEPLIRALESEVSTKLARHGTMISHNAALFERIAAVWREREMQSLSPEQLRLIDNIYKGFVRAGAGLRGVAKERFAEIEARLAALSVRFGQNVVAASSTWEMILRKDDLAGLPESVFDAAARRAEERGHREAFLFTLDRGDFENFLAFSERRDLRERIWRAFTGRCHGGAHDNNPVIAETVALRHESARLLGYPDYATYRLDDSMAGAPEAAEALMLRIWSPALEKAREEAAALQGLIDIDGGEFTLAAWDWRLYAERLRKERYAVDAAAIRSHLRLDKVRDAAFDAAQRLYGLRFRPAPEVPVYHPDVQAFAISNHEGMNGGLLYTDYLARPEKRGGAWMGSLRVQEKLDGPVAPIVYTVANFAQAIEPTLTCISLDEARTLFHEFGHALHALLSNVTYPSLAGTAVARDFVEFPSKFMEHWIVAPEVLRRMEIPEDLINAIGRADVFGQGLETVEFLASAIVDLSLHRRAPPSDAAAFESSELARLDLPDAMAMRHRLSHFTHIFDGGYASAYYSYLWSEVLEADAFAAFTEGDGIFDSALAARLRDEVLSRGNSREPLASYVAFRGRPPSEAALLEARGID